MKIRDCRLALITALVVCFRLFFENLSSAQALSRSEHSDSIVALAADSLGLPFMEPDERPIFGTFWEVRGTLPCISAPLPYPPFDPATPVYIIVGEHYLVDQTAGNDQDNQVSYRRSRTSMNPASFLAEQLNQVERFVNDMRTSLTDAEVGTMALGLEPPPIPGTGGTNDSGMPPLQAYQFTTNDLWLEIQCITNGTGVFTVHPPFGERVTGVYDLLMTTNLHNAVPGLNLTNWYWVLRTEPGVTNFLLRELWHENAFFRLGRTNDTDADGISDVLERSVTHTDPNVVSSNPFPLIISQPMSQTVDWGDTVTFAVETTSPLPLAYQWYFADYSGTTSISGATSAALTVSSVELSDAGNYFVKISNPLGSILSSNSVLTVQDSGENAIVLYGARQNLRLTGDVTYFVDGSSGPVELFGETVIEGGSVVKFAANENARIIVKGPVTTQTGPYRPAVFTAQDDDLVGWVLNVSTSVPTNFYAPTALEIASTTNTSLGYLRFLHSGTAICFKALPDHQVTDTLSHVQILHCDTAIRSEGSGSTSRLLRLRNLLISDVARAISGSRVTGDAQFLTVDACSSFAVDSIATGLPFNITNSIFCNVTNLGAGVVLSGSHNGFYPDTVPQFGSSAFTEQSSPFELIYWVDQDGTPYYNWANGQGAYYLRALSAFNYVGSTNIDPAVTKAFAQMTSYVPPEVLFSDITSTYKLIPSALRDPGARNLGYHYPVVDYVINGVTVNYATLKVEPGTVLGFIGLPNNWGIRLNPGGRLEVNGTPDNRVVFAHMDAVQESPVWELEPFGPTLTWRELSFFGGIPTPYPEAKISYADFPTISGGFNAHLAPINNYLGVFYSIISTLLIDGCHFQGGWFLYDDGGPKDRSLTVRNSIFNSCQVGFYNTGRFTSYYNQPEFSSQLSIVNNVFYQCPMLLSPVSVSSGTNWTFTDNIFDHVMFVSDDYGINNGPIGVNHHNAYVGMAVLPSGANRLSPAASAMTDPDLLFLNYESGPLGDFYLPTSASELIGKGSRSGSAAGEFHFTCQTNQQSPGQVSIGAHYLALASTGAIDSNNDGVPNFVADRNRDGTEDLDEMRWQNAATGGLRIISPASNSVNSGIMRLRFDLGTNTAVLAGGLHAYIDGEAADGGSVQNPALATEELEIDTRYLTNGPHLLSLHSAINTTVPGAWGPLGIESPSVMITVSNGISHPFYQDRAEQTLRIKLQTPASMTNYVIHVFRSGYAKATDPFAPSTYANWFVGTNTDGNISFSEPMANLTVGDEETVLYTFVEASSYDLMAPPQPGESQTTVNPPIRKERPYPLIGCWAAAYDNSVVEYHKVITEPALDQVSFYTDDLGNPLRWRKDVHLGAWKTAGTLATAGALPTLAYSPEDNGPGMGQTWPMRGAEASSPGVTNGTNLYYADRVRLRVTLFNPNVRNFYGFCHGASDQFGGWFSDQLKEAIKHRYRFVFLDGCNSYSDGNFTAFGALKGEAMKLQDGAFYTNSVRPAAYIGCTVKQPAGYPLNQPVPNVDTNQPPYRVATFDTICQWHRVFFNYWTSLGGSSFGVTQAKARADEIAWNSPNANPPRRNVPVDGGTNGPVVNYDPTVHIKIGGYGGLTFNGFNHGSDKW